MEEKHGGVHIAGVDIRIGIAIALCLLVCRLAALAGWEIQSLAACTAVIMCVQANGKSSLHAGMTRLLGVLCGGVVGIAVVVIDNAVQIAGIFFVLAGVGAVLTLLLCKIVRIPPIAGRVSCMTLLLVILVAQGSGRIGYAFGRLIGTLCGALVSLLVAAAWDALSGKKAKPAAAER